MAFKTRQGLYKPMVMFFGLTNSPAMFQGMMNSLYRDTITKHKAFGTFIQIYMDNIAIATCTPSLEAIAAVMDILAVARDNSLFFKLSKCVFHAPSIDYLGVILERGVTCMDPVKVAGICDWPTPKNTRRCALSTVFAIFIAPLSRCSQKSCYHSMH